MDLVKGLIPKSAEKPRVAIAAAEDDTLLETAIKAKEEGLAEPILFGNISRINDIAQENDLSIDGIECVEAHTGKHACQRAIMCIRDGGADVLMKGNTQTSILLKAVLDKEKGLRKGKMLSHLSIHKLDMIDRLILMTDAALVPYPDLKAKAELVKNAVKAAHKLGIESPKVAPLAAVEVVNPDMQATIDAAALTQMNRRGQIKGCVIDGPLAIDLALSEEAAKHKGVAGEVAGKADILLFHNIEAGNSVTKTFTHIGGSLFGGVVMGATVPIALTSRSDSCRSKLFSIACACAVSQGK